MHQAMRSVSELNHSSLKQCCLRICVAIFCVLLTAVVSGAVSGGSSDTINHAPFLVSLNTGKLRRRHFCGGTIISPTWVLTAGHCMTNVSPQDFTVRAGSSYMNQGGQVRNVSGFVVHEYYNAFIRKDYDFALVQLASPLIFGIGVQPLKLTNNLDQHVSGEKCFIAGWGRTEINRKTVEHMRSAMVPLVSRAKCQRSFPAAYITEAMLCVGGNGTNACHGDSGGPLVCKAKLTGIVSWGRGDSCGKKGPYVVYGNVAEVRTWIFVHSGV